MAWNDLFTSSSGGYGNWLGGGSSSSGFDWGSLAGDIGQSGGSWSKYFGSGSSKGDSGWGSLLGAAGSLFGGGSSSGGSSNGAGGELFKGVLSGLGASADAKGQLEMVRDVTKLKGLEDRKSTAFEAELVDYYKRRDRAEKKMGLDQYGQFSRVKQFAPNYTATYNGPAMPGPTPPQPKA